MDDRKRAEVRFDTITPTSAYGRLQSLSTSDLLTEAVAYQSLVEQGRTASLGSTPITLESYVFSELR